MFKNTIEEDFRQTITYKRLKNGSLTVQNKNENQFFIEFCLSNGPEIKVFDWPGYHTTTLPVDKSQINEIREKVLALFKDRISDYTCIGSSADSTSNTGHKFFLYKFTNLYMLTYTTKIWFYSSSLEVIEKIERLTKSFRFSADRQVYLLTSTIDGVTLTASKPINEPFIFENYTDSVSNSLKKALTWSQEAKPKGRILIMAGPPGTGKSYAIRGLISESNGVDWALIPSYLVPELSSPNIIATLINERSDSERPLNLIIEDADNLLKKREENNPDIISQVLNLGDGILGELINVKLIMTTNCARVNMDEAITRQGRLNSFIDFQLLPPSQAQSIYKKLSNRDIKYTINKALYDIYADAFYQELNVPKKELSGNYL